MFNGLRISCTPYNQQHHNPHPQPDHYQIADHAGDYLRTRQQVPTRLCVNPGD